MLFIIVTKNEVFIFVKAYACYYLFLVHWQTTNKNIIMSSFKSSGDIQKKEGEPDSCFG